MIAERERATYEDVWAIPTYAVRSPGVQYLPFFEAMCQPLPGARILDAGAGSGAAAVELQRRGFDVRLADITDAGFSPEASNLPRRLGPLWLKMWPDRAFDYVFCCDVMEHIPPTFAMLVVHRLLAASTRGVFFSIALTPDNYGAWVGTPLHQNVQPFTAWRDQLSSIGIVMECRDLISTGLYYVTPQP